MTWKGHWHGYGPWKGQRAELTDQQRRPGLTPDDDQTRAFLATSYPPLIIGNALLRRNQTTRDRTWTDVSDAVNWLTAVYNDDPEPFTPSDLYATPDERFLGRIQYAEQSLARGDDEAWGYYTRHKTYIVYSVICCPGRYFHKEIPCPLPPS